MRSDWPAICAGTRYRFATAATFAILCMSLAAHPSLAQPASAAPRAAFAQATPAQAKPGVPLSPQALASLLPQAVYFQGRTAPVQLRNAAGVTFGNGAIVWAALVDTSGYASNVQQKYQFYLVTECNLRFGNARLPAGVYGGGFVGDRFIVMDVGGHTIAQGPIQTDSAMPRPRPLQMLPESPDAVRLVLGRRWVRLQASRP